MDLEKGEDPNEADQAIILRCAFDIQLYAREFFPHYCVLDFNPFHREYFEAVRYGERKVRRAGCAPRGYAKSTLAALVKPLHDLCYGLEKFILIASNTQSQANGKLKDIRNEILTNTALVDAFGVGFPRKAVGESEYIAHSRDGDDVHQVMFKAVGAGVQVRGIRFNEARPSKIICDDVEHSEEVLNEEIRAKYSAWFTDDISKVGDQNTNIEFIGTMLHERALLADVCAMPEYTAKKYKAVISWAKNSKLWQEWQDIYTNLDSDTRLSDSNAFYDQHKDALMEGVEVLWPEKEPYLALVKELINGGRRSFMREKQNEPMGSDARVFEKIHYYRETSEGILIESSKKLIPYKDLQQSAYGVLDPATGKKRASSKGDFACLLTGYKEDKGRLLVHRDWTQREPPTKYIAEIFKMHQEFDYQKFGVEENLYRELLLPNLVDERKRIQEATGKIVKLGFYEIDQTKNKIERITAIEPKVTHGWILFNRSLSKEFINQLLYFPSEHDDGPDALEMLWNLVHNRYKVASVSVNAQGNR